MQSVWYLSFYLLAFFFFFHVVFTYLLFTLLPSMHVQSCLITSFLNVFFLCVKYMSTVKRGGHSSAHSSAKSPGEPLLLWLCITSMSPPLPLHLPVFLVLCLWIFSSLKHIFHWMKQGHNNGCWFGGFFVEFQWNNAFQLLDIC